MIHGATMPLVTVEEAPGPVLWSNTCSVVPRLPVPGRRNSVALASRVTPLVSVIDTPGDVPAVGSREALAPIDIELNVTLPAVVVDELITFNVRCTSVSPPAQE